MNYKLLLLFIGILLLSCNTSDNGPSGFIETSPSYGMVDFIEDINNGEDNIFITTEVVEVLSSDNEGANTFSRIITVNNNDAIQSLYFHLNLDNQGNTIDIASMQYAFYEETKLVSYSYSKDQSNEDNPQLLNDNIIESTNAQFKANISGVLSSYEITDNSYSVLEFSDIDLDFTF